MRRLSILPLVAAFALGTGSVHAETAAMSYPPAKKIDNVDDYHGTKVADPYRWLEQDVREHT